LNKIGIIEALLSWYKINGKDYPFRKTKDPYRILVSEMLLRKTTARQVAAVYEEFFNEFPKVANLASAPCEKVLDIIRPLGLHQRAAHLIQLARVIDEKFGGAVPNSVEELTSMEGVGRYTANCVMAFSFGANLPLVDSNVERVLCRFRSIRQSKGHPGEEVWRTYASFLPDNRLRTIHYALIDLSHEICRPSDPLCHTCPLSKHCRYFEGQHTKI
jgi:A/G-specific adenine glycosylase